MKPRKWLGYEEPNEESGLYIVWYDYGTGEKSPAYMNKDAFEVAKIENELIEKGYNIEDLDKYKEAVYDYAYGNAEEDFSYGDMY